MQHNNCSQRFSQACAVPCGLHRQFVIIVTSVIIIILLIISIVITVAYINSNKHLWSSWQQQIWSFLCFNIGPKETGQSYFESISERLSPLSRPFSTRQSTPNCATTINIIFVQLFTSQKTKHIINSTFLDELPFKSYPQWITPDKYIFWIWWCY